MKTRLPSLAASDRSTERHRLFGRHAVTAALANPARPCFVLRATAPALAKLGAIVDRQGLVVETARPEQLSRLLPAEAQHQGLLLEVGALPTRALEEVWVETADVQIVLALDEINDPRNLGAILRSAAAFGAAAVIVPERRSAALGAICAKAASGALDIVPVIEVANLARALERLKEHSFWCIGLDADAPLSLASAPRADRRVLVLGGEGRGLRRLVAESCDVLAKLPMTERIESLNVAAAASVALYELSHLRADQDQ